MPKFEISKSDLEKLVGKKFTAKELEDALLFAKTELDGQNGDTLKVDVKDTNRPDLWSVEGIARELKGHFRIEEGLPKYNVKKSGLQIFVEAEEYHVHAVGVVVKNLKIDDNVLSQMIQLQEKVAGTFGRNRKALSIGAYDLGKVKFPVKYVAKKPQDIRFAPLGFNKEMTAKEILANHEKGKQYGEIIKNAKTYNVWEDANKKILAFEPIINSNGAGNVTTQAKDIFLECTGDDLKQIQIAINVVATALAERGGQIESIEVVHKNRKTASPDLTPKKSHLDPEYCRKILGLEISDTEMVKLLKEARHDAKLDKKKIGQGTKPVSGPISTISVEYPAYRNDIMHQRDLVEDVAISFGYNDIEPETPKIATIGASHKLEDFSNIIREICVGLGLQEVLTFTLTNKDNMFKKMNLSEKDLVEIENPMSSNWSAFRDKIMPNSLDFLASNKNQDYPQGIFEVGDVTLLDPSNKDTGVTNRRKFSVVLTNTQIGYEDASSLLSALVSSLGKKLVLKRKEISSFIAGRAAEIFLDNKSIGIIGEIHPQVLNNWNLEKPVVGFEIDIESLLELIQ